MFEVGELLKYELAHLSLYLEKENKLRKPEKHNLANKIEVTFQVSPLNHVCIHVTKRDFVRFYGNIKKIPTENLKAFGELVATLRKHSIFQKTYNAST